MPICDICHKDKQEGEEKEIHTACIVSKTEKVLQDYGNSRYVQTTTRYNDFEEHRYFLCAQCKSTWDKIVMPAGVVLVLLATAALFIAAARLHHAWLFVGALLALIVGMGPVSHLGTNARLNKKALAERGASIKGIHAFYFTGETEEYKTFDEKEMAKLQVTN